MFKWTTSLYSSGSSSKKMMKNHHSTQPSAKKTSSSPEKTMMILKRIFSTRQAWAAFFCHFGAVGTYVGFIGSWVCTIWNECV